jgi:hypothetical protein
MHLIAHKEMVMLGFLRKRTTCSCSKGSAHWSWPFTRAHEKYSGQIVTTVTCQKHPWSVHLYDLKNMRFVTPTEEGEVLRQIQVLIAQNLRGESPAGMTPLPAAGV